MRQKRTKVYKKLMHQFQLHFGFREPYQMLIDDTFAQSLVRLKTQNPSQQFANVLCGKVKPMITQCCMVELYKLGKDHQQTVDLAKEWERRKCNHREAIEPHECIGSVIGENNKHRYVLASDSQRLRGTLRTRVPGLPMVHFTQAVMVLEPMSDLSRSKVDQIEDAKLSGPSTRPDPSAGATNIIGADAEAAGPSESQPPLKKRKGPKAPNPLSVKKPKRERLSVEEKMAREQELKKRKQKEKAAERLRAQKLDGERAESQAQTEGSGKVAAKKVDGETVANGNTAGAKRKRAELEEPAVAKAHEPKAADASEPGAKSNNRRRRPAKKKTASSEGHGAEGA